MEKSNTIAEKRLEDKKKKAKSKKILLILFGIAFLAFVLWQSSSSIQQLFCASYNPNPVVNESSNSITSDAYVTVKGTIMGLIESEKYSWFIKLLILLGTIYIIQIALFAVFDVIEILALLYLLITKIYKKICKLCSWKRKKQGRKKRESQRTRKKSRKEKSEATL